MKKVLLNFAESLISRQQLQTIKGGNCYYPVNTCAGGFNPGGVLPAIPGTTTGGGYTCVWSGSGTFLGTMFTYNNPNSMGSCAAQYGSCTSAPCPAGYKPY